MLVVLDQLWYLTCQLVSTNRETMLSRTRRKIHEAREIEPAMPDRASCGVSSIDPNMSGIVIGRNGMIVVSAPSIEKDQRSSNLPLITLSLRADEKKVCSRARLLEKYNFCMQVNDKGPTNGDLRDDNQI